MMWTRLQKINPPVELVHREPMVGLEPTTSGLQNRCSTTELHRLRGLATIHHKQRFCKPLVFNLATITHE
jgi:hypothetical protein